MSRDNGEIGVLSYQVLPQRVYLNAFPKSGTHLAELFVRLIAAPITDKPWLGSFNGNAWLNEWVDLSKLKNRIDNWSDGGYFKGHCGYNPNIAEWLWNNDICTIFVYRDLRDVAVSQAHHVLNTEKNEDGTEKLAHPGKELYQQLASFEDVLMATLQGYGIYPGLISRWNRYKQWLNEKWVLPIRYEDMVQEPCRVGSLVLRYVTGQTASFYGRKITLDRESHDAIVDGMIRLIDQHKPATYRKGEIGNWQDCWTEKVNDVWLSVNGHIENAKIGYEST